MKKTSIALLLVFTLVFASFVSMFTVSAAYSLVEDTSKAYDVKEGVHYTEYQLTSGVNGTTVKANMLEFSPEDYIPMVFSCWAGSTGLCAKQYEYAEQKYGYDVAAVMNGAFFSMADGTLVGINISNGKISCAHAGYSGEVVAFSSDGHFDVVNSNITYTLNIDGKDVPNGIYYINKHNGESESGWSPRFYYFDTSCGSQCDTYAECPGTEIICRKAENSELVVGGTLKGEVIEVKKNSYGTYLADNTYDLSDKFVLFLKAGSSYESYIEGLEAGALVEISADETVVSSKEIMENASSVITNVGWLVKDGVDQTKINSTIGTHSVTLKARWNAFGVKADGTYVFFTSEGGTTGDGESLAATLKDVARTMMDAGCVNVIRMDGGGSVALYVEDDGTGKPGYKTPSTRPVSDCILIIKRPEASENQAAALDAFIAQAEEALAASEDEAMREAYEAGLAVKESKHSTSGDYIRAIMKFDRVFGGLAELSDLIAAAKSISYSDYTDEDLAAIQEAYQYAVAVKATKDATIAAVNDAVDKLSAALALNDNAALGKSYTANGLYPDTKTATYPDEGGVTLTDGKDAAASYSDYGWVGFNSGSSELSGVSPKVGTIIVDLEEQVDIASFALNVFDGLGDAGIKAPSYVEFFYSSDNSNWTSAGKVSTLKVQSAVKCLNSFELAASAPITARYVKAVFGFSSTWAFISEIKVIKSYNKVSNVGWVKGFNSSIAAGDAFIFTPDTCPDLSTVNLRWSQNIYLIWDESANGFKVTKTEYPDGKDGTAYTDDMICIGVHNSEVAGDADGSAANRSYAATAKIGDYVEFHGININSKDVLPGGYFKIVKAADFNDEFNGMYETPEFDIPTNAVKPLEGTANLVPEMVYDQTSGGGSNAEYTFDGEVLIVDDTGAGWPCISGTYAKPIIASLEGTTIDIDFTVEGGNTAIILNTSDQSIKIHQNVNGSLDSGSGDLYAGTYKVSCDLKDILAYDATKEPSSYSASTALVPDEDGNITFTGITIYATGGAKVTINSLKITSAKPEVRGDMNEDGKVNSADAVYLLRYTMRPDKYPITQSGDVNGDGKTNSADAVYLLRHTMRPDKYPLAD